MAKRRHESEAGKQGRIADELRTRIVSGRLKPGDRLPTQVKLIDKYKVSGVTIQRALDRLVRDGFIETHGRRGTFVVERPPHLNQYALVFCEPTQDDKHPSRFYRVLEQVVRQVESNRQCGIQVYHGITHDRGEAYLQLLDDAQHHRLAGIVAVDPWPLHRTALIVERLMPLCNIVAGRLWPDVPRVYPAVLATVDMALDEVMRIGAERVAMIATAQSYHFISRHLVEAARARKIDLPPHWLQVTPAWPADAASHAVQLLMRGAARQRPQVLLVLDDNIHDAVAAGLVAAEMSVPRDVQVIAMCNFPAPLSVLPMQRLGVETADVLSAALDVIDQQRRGEQPAMVTEIPPRLEEV